MILQPIERLNLALSAGATAASWWLVSPVFALSLGFGALLEAVNFRGLHQQAQLLFWGEIRSGGGWTGLYALRFGLLVIGIGGGLALGAHPVGLVIGLSLIMPTTIWVRVAQPARDRPERARARVRRPRVGALESVARARAGARDEDDA